jgi:hypothetical protein
MAGAPAHEPPSAHPTDRCDGRGCHERSAGETSSHPWADSNFPEASALWRQHVSLGLSHSLAEATVVAVAEAGDKAFWNVVITLVPFLILWDNRSPPGFSGSDYEPLLVPA